MDDLPIPDDNLLLALDRDDWQRRRDRKKFDGLDLHDLPPSGHALALAHDMVAALAAGDATRALESAAALSRAAALVVDLLDDDVTDYNDLVVRAHARVGVA